MSARSRSVASTSRVKLPWIFGADTGMLRAW